MTERIDEATLVKLVRERGLVDEASARRAIVATLEALGAHVPQPERDAFGLALPQKLAHALAARRFRGPGDLAALEKALVKSEHESRGFAREELEIVCGALGEMLPEELERRVERALSAEIAELFHPPSHDFGDAPSYELEDGHTLATGHPGSDHPISTSAPKRSRE